ncbi:MAG: glycerophosphoryl diester phosphodiesterase membrane domain-containing protein, partial [Novosphingobium sp.]|nr:glycerophosphoryl diester phosphodiesterase membrane domain-containing protein [Novosphingobium sp.]
LVAIIATYALMGAFFLSALSGMGGLAALQGNPEAFAQIFAGMGFGFFLVYLVVLAISLVAQAAICALCGDPRRPTIGEALTTGVRSLPALGGAFLLVIVGAIGIGILFALLMAGAAMGAQQPWLIFVLGLVAMVGAAYLMTKLSMVLPVVVLDEVRGPLMAIGRSWQLTRGNSLRLFGYFLLIGILMGVVYFALVAALGGVGNSGGGIAVAIVLGLLVLVYALLAGIYWLAAVVAAHRQLGGPSTGAIEDTFA